MKINPNSQRQQIMKLKQDLYLGNITLQELKEQYIDLYVSDYVSFEAIWKQHFKDFNPDPKKRLNLVLCGSDSDNQTIKGGTGKTTLSYLLPLELGFDLEKDFFSFTDGEAGFFNYQNQVVVVWNEIRNSTIYQFGVPKFLTATDKSDFLKSNMNVKYGAVKLCNEVNMINTSQPFKSFLLGLTDRYKDKQGEYSEPENFSQIERRFPVCLTFEKRIVSENEYETIITCKKHNEGIPSDILLNQYQDLFVCKIKTNKTNFKKKLKIFSQWFIKFINQKTYDFDFSNLKKYFQQREVDDVSDSELEQYLQMNLNQFSPLDILQEKKKLLEEQKNLIDWKKVVSSYEDIESKSAESIRDKALS